MDRYKTLTIGSQVFELRELSISQRGVQYNETFYEHLWQLTAIAPILSKNEELISFVEIANFFWKGSTFCCIESAQVFQKNYIEQLEKEKTCPADVFAYRLSDYKTFDVSVMKDPVIEGGQATFYVYQVETGVPYRVVCPFPYLSPSTVHYQILPLQEDCLKEPS